MAEQSMEEFLGDVLNNKIPVITELGDLPSVWRDTPPGEPDPNHPGFPNRAALLDTYIGTAETKRWARDGLRRLLGELLDNGEPVPQPLGWWAIRQCAQGDPAPSRGRPEESDRDFRVSVVFALLQFEGFTCEAAMGFIAERLVCEPETVRSILRKLRRELSSR